MKIKNLYLAAAIISTLLLILLLVDPIPQEIFGYNISIWFRRAIWFILAVINIKNFININKSENETK